MANGWLQPPLDYSEPPFSHPEAHWILKYILNIGFYIFNRNSNITMIYISKNKNRTTTGSLRPMLHAVDPLPPPLGLATIRICLTTHYPPSDFFSAGATVSIGVKKVARFLSVAMVARVVRDLLVRALYRACARA